MKGISVPGYRQHLVGGLVAFSLLSTALTMSECVIIKNFIPVIGWMMCSLAGSLFPDIDIKSKGQKYFYWIILGLLLYFTYYELFLPLAALSILSTTPMLVRHRGIFHNIWALFGGFAALSYVLMRCMPCHTDLILIHVFFFLGGVISHIWLDMGLIRMLRARSF